MENLNDLYLRDIEADKQVFLVLRDVVNSGIEYFEDNDNRNSAICALIPALESLLEDKESGLKNKIKAKDFHNPAKNIPPNKLHLLKNLNEFWSKRLEIAKVLLEGIQYKKEFLAPQMKKLNDYLKKFKHFKEVNFKGFKFGVGYADLLVFGANYDDIWAQQDKSFEEKSIKTRKLILSFIAETILGCIGTDVIKALVKPVFGKFIGILLFLYFLSLVSDSIGEWIYDILTDLVKKLAGIFDDDGGDDGLGPGFLGFIRRKKDDDDDDDDDGGDPPFPPCAGFAVAMRSGGVEFHLPKQINNFRSFFSFNKCHYTAFEYEGDLNIRDIIDLVNTKFLINNIKVNSLDEIYDTILEEIAYGFLCRKDLPSISLNFNKDGLLYSIMNNYYKNTLTGNILTFLDYYLKSYANGAFFKEEFIYEWQTEKNQNFDYLSKYLIDFKKYIHNLKNDENKINYCSIYDMVNSDITESYENNYISAFRIIGNLNSNLSYYKNLFFPRCFYITQYNFDIMPQWKKVINQEIIDNINKKHEENRNEIKKNKGREENIALILEDIHKVMANRVTFLMNKIPFLKPYFELLKMITFAIHYLPNIHRTGLFPLFDKSIQNNHINVKYCKSIPKVFPPLPIRKTINLKIEIFPDELLNCFKSNNFEEINKFISICYYENKGFDMNEIVQKQMFLLDKIKQYIRDKIRKKLPPEDKNVFLYLTDENMKIPQALSKLQDILFLIPIVLIKPDLDFILNILNKNENKKNNEN